MIFRQDNMIELFSKIRIFQYCCWEKQKTEVHAKTHDNTQKKKKKKWAPRCQSISSPQLSSFHIQQSLFHSLRRPPYLPRYLNRPTTSTSFFCSQPYHWTHFLWISNLIFFPLHILDGQGSIRTSRCSFLIEYPK